MPNPVVSLRVVGLHDAQNIKLELREGLNIVHGRNGTGKTTLLHIIANLADCDVERFSHLKFETIDVLFQSGASISLRRHVADDDVHVHVQVDGRPMGSVARGEETPRPLQELITARLGGRAVYQPAFRSVLEAGRLSSPVASGISGDEESIRRIARRERNYARDAREEDAVVFRGVDENRFRAIAQKTLICREWFGAFVPVIRSPSLADVSDELMSEMQVAEFRVSIADRAELAEVFVGALEAAINDREPQRPEDVHVLLTAIQGHLRHFEGVSADSERHIYSRLAEAIRGVSQVNEAENRVRRILTVYEQSLRRRTEAENEAFRRIRTFEASVNRFLEGKQLAIAATGVRTDRLHGFGRRTIRAIRLAHDEKLRPLSILSSGERHVLTLLFSATHMAPADGMVLIDEPELSLHVDWQRDLLKEVGRQAGERQIIVCTHSPEIAADHTDSLRSILAVPFRAKQSDLFESR